MTDPQPPTITPAEGDSMTLTVGGPMNLYEITDAGLDFYVLAESIGHAITRWRDKLNEINNARLDETTEPETVDKLCGPEDMLVEIDEREEMNKLRLDLKNANGSWDNVATQLRSSERQAAKAMELIAWTREVAGMKTEDDYKDSILIMAQQVQDYERHLKALAGKND